MSLLDSKKVLKPYQYPWSYEFWETQQKLHWTPEEVNLHDDVQDWQHKLNSEERNLLTQIFRFFTQMDVEVQDCYRAGTEILTGRGWVDFRDLREEDVVAQVRSDGRSEFVKPTAIIRKENSGRMMQFRSHNGIDLIVTDTHDMVFRRSGVLEKHKANAVPFSHNLVQPVAAVTAMEGEGLTDFERYLIAFQADGSVNHHPAHEWKGEVTFRFKKQRKIDRLQAILQGVMFGDHPVSWTSSTFSDGITCFMIKDNRDDYSIWKSFGWVDLTKITSQWAKEFIEELSYWDARRSESGNFQFRSIRKDAADMVQAIAVLAGYKAKLVHNTYEYQSEHYLVSITPHRDSVSIYRMERNVIESQEEVYCVTVPSGMIVVRNNGLPVVSGNCYMSKYAAVFKPTEIKMMLTAFANMETIHVAAYSLLLDTIGMPETEYSAFLQYAEMRDKSEHLNQFDTSSRRGIARTLAGVSAFGEGVSLFASFVMLLNFTRFGKMKGMGQIVSWSVRDESLHCRGMIKLFRAFIQENPDIWDDEMKKSIYEAARRTVQLEDAFIDLAFSQGGVEGVTPEEVKQYIRYICDRRLIEMGMKSEFNVRENPLPWVDSLISGVEHTNFFENRPTQYAKAATTGNWSDAYSEMFDLQEAAD